MNNNDEIINDNRKNKWVLAWMYNDKPYSKEYEFQTIAELEKIRLEAYGLSVSIHRKDDL